MFEWKESYEIGNGPIDEQHQRLFEIGRKLHDLMKEKRGVDKYDELMDVIHELTEYTIYHFDFEEGMMEGAGYPGLPGHQKEHQKFIDQLRALEEQDVDQFQNKVAFEALGVVANWIEQHILNTDTKYKDYI